MKSPSINPNIAFQFMKRPSSLMTRRMALRLQTCEVEAYAFVNFLDAAPTDWCSVYVYACLAGDY